MQMSAVMFLAALALQGAPVAGVAPVQKVIQMLSEMKAKGAAELEKEQKIYAEYAEWVDDQTRECGFEIKTLNSEIAELTAAIEKTDNDVKTLGDEMDKLDAQLGTLEADKGEADALRDKEHAEFIKVEQDYSESVDALERAIQVLKSQPSSVAQAESLLQKMTATVPGMQRVLAGFLELKATTQQARGAPAVAAYENQSGGIVAMLEKLLDKFRSELDEVNTEEANKAHAYELEVLHLSNTIDQLKADREEKSATKGKLSAQSGAMKGRLADAKVDLASVEKTLADMGATFRLKKEQYEANQKVRKEEIEALAKAIEIISSPEVADSYATHVKLAQVGSRGVSLLQEVSTTDRVAAKRRVEALLQRKAAVLSSTALATLASQVMGNPFAKVIDMIEKLLERLKEEAAAEADHKAWCDDQLHKNKIKRDKKTLQADKLIAEIAQLSGEIDTMGAQIAELVQEQAALTKAMGEATAVREKEQAENEVTIADAKSAQVAVKQALEILHEFYGAQAALLQKSAQVPEMAAYKGQQKSKTGVIGMLEVILSDFARLEAETTADESTAAAQYESFMADAKAEKKQKHKSEVKLKLEKDQAEFEKGQLEDDLREVEAELARANEYFEYLKPSCLEVKVSYGDRAAKRQEEIAALKEAYELLDGHTMG